MLTFKQRFYSKMENINTLTRPLFFSWVIVQRVVLTLTTHQLSEGQWGGGEGEPEGHLKVSLHLATMGHVGSCISFIWEPNMLFDYSFIPMFCKQSLA
jgi:hypothetical protein